MSSIMNTTTILGSEHPEKLSFSIIVTVVVHLFKHEWVEKPKQTNKQKSEVRKIQYYEILGMISKKKNV